MQKPTQLDDVRNDVRGLMQAMLAMFGAVVRSGAIPEDDAEEVLEEMLVTISPRSHQLWRDTLHDVLAERALHAGQIVAERTGHKPDPLPDALRNRAPST